MHHANYDDFWTARNLRPHLKNIRPAVLTVGGWFDAENIYGALETYKNVESSSPGTTNVLVMGPWRHGGWGQDDGSSLGPIPFNTKTAAHFREKIEFPFFQFFLKGKGTASFPEARVFETGTNQWREYDTWPPRKARSRSFYLSDSGRISNTPPEASGAAGLRRIHQRSFASGGVCRSDHSPDERRLHDSRSALCRTAAGRAGLPDGPAGSRHDAGGNDGRSAFCLDFGNRFRLGRQADRRVSRRFSGNRRWWESQSRWAAISNWCAAT